MGRKHSVKTGVYVNSSNLSNRVFEVGQIQILLPSVFQFFAFNFHWNDWYLQDKVTW